MAEFKVGDQASWVSQAAGYTKEKSGIVAEVVQPKCLPDRNRFPSLYANAGVGMWRDHVSYVVCVPGPSGRGVGKPYWPRVKQLRSGSSKVGTE